MLEIGLGTGSDFVRWVRAGADCYRRDLTLASVALVNERPSLEGLTANVNIGDAENLKFPENFFDLVYSWGVLHHTPDTERAFGEAHRVLKPGGVLKVMLYHYPSVSAFLIWLLYGAMRLNFTNPRKLCADHIESPGTRFYTVKEARDLVGNSFTNLPDIRTYLGAGDLLTNTFSERYRSGSWKFLKDVYPRWLVRSIVGHRFGTVMTIEVVK